jgi:hypothetical protein
MVILAVDNGGVFLLAKQQTQVVWRCHYQQHPAKYVKFGTVHRKLYAGCQLLQFIMLAFEFVCSGTDSLYKLSLLR